MRILQLMPTIVYGDAVSNDALAIQDLLARHGIVTLIYAENIGAKLQADYIRSITELPETEDDDVIIYHASTGSSLNERLCRMHGKKIMVYHNITPASFFSGYSQIAEKLTQKGYKEIKALAPYIDFVIGDSQYNMDQLKIMGYKCPMVRIPILIPYEDYRKQPSNEIIQRYTGDGYQNFLFVGRIAPNKRQEDVIAAFCAYRQKYNTKSRLFLVGNGDGMENYVQRLQNYVRFLGLDNSVIFTGHIRFDEILAYYTIADLFVCMSEHEGFCVPLVETMYFDKDIVAYDSSAVPETLGKAGVLLDSKDPELAADVFNQVLTRKHLRTTLANERKKQLLEFEPSKVEEQFVQVLQDLDVL